MRFVDSHLHLSDYQDPVATLALAAATQTLLVSCSTDFETSLKTLRLQESSPDLVSAFVGVHPSEAETDRRGVEGIRSMLAAAAGLGEVGLDPKYSPTGSGSRQVSMLKDQLELAQKHEKPVQVHSRGAEASVLEILGGFTLRGGVLLHWFQGEELVPEVTNRGAYVSFGPALLTSKKLERMARRLDRNLALVETDGPVRFRGLGGGGGPSLVSSVVFKLSEVWGVGFEDARETLLANSARFLGLPWKG